MNNSKWTYFKTIDKFQSHEEQYFHYLLFKKEIEKKILEDYGVEILEQLYHDKVENKNKINKEKNCNDCLKLRIIDEAYLKGFSV